MFFWELNTQLFLFDGMETQINKKWYYFGFRFENELKERVLNYCEQESISMNGLVEEALELLFHLHDHQQVALNKSFSGFKTRSVFGDKVDAMLILKAVIREQVRVFAICYRRSMAEIIRIALELFLDSMDPINSKLGKIKHYYSMPQPIIQATLIGLYPIYPPPL